jgi:hypothetical protein
LGRSSDSTCKHMFSNSLLGCVAMITQLQMTLNTLVSSSVLPYGPADLSELFHSNPPCFLSPYVPMTYFMSCARFRRCLDWQICCYPRGSSWRCHFERTFWDNQQNANYTVQWILVLTWTLSLCAAIDLFWFTKIILSSLFREEWDIGLMSCHYSIIN